VGNAPLSNARRKALHDPGTPDCRHCGAVT